MRKEEDILRKKVGKTNPFQVPESYFDSFTEQLMNALPEPAATPATPIRKPLIRRIGFHTLCAAASICALAVLGTTLYLRPADAEGQTATSPSIELMADNADFVYFSEEYIDDALDYAMVDNQEIAYYLTEAY